MIYSCFSEGKKIYEHDVCDDQENKVDFYIAAENALEYLDKSNKFPDKFKLMIEVVGESGKKKNCEVIKEIMPRYTSICVEDDDDDL